MPTQIPSGMIHYAHTATNPDGTPGPNQEHWHFLECQLYCIASRSANFAPSAFASPH